MKVAVMQPYLFPYLGYYQLVNYVDTFVFYDDVTFIKQGYINRNYILLNGKPTRITVPVPGASSNKKIKELEFSLSVGKILKTIMQAYSKAPFFDVIYPLVERVFTHPNRNIADVCQLSIAEVFRYLDIKKNMLKSSELKYCRSLSAASRLVDICKTLGSNHYVNSAGGSHLYSKTYFATQRCKLSFLQLNNVCYPQGNTDFVPNLSIVDALMWCDKERISELLQSFTLL